LMIIGIGVTAILGAVGVATQASTLDERQIQAQALLRSWGEHVVATTTDGTYTPCATTATYGSAPWRYASPAPAGLQELPTGFTASVTRVQYWDGGSPGSFVSSCATDRGVQRVRLTMTVADALYPGFASTYDVVVRRPCTTLGPGGC
jgi:hypothetical protein